MFILLGGGNMDGVKFDLNELPNFMIVPHQRETPENIIKACYESIMYAIDKTDYEDISEILEMFFDDVNYWSIREYLITQTKVNILTLQTLDASVEEFIEDEFDEVYTDDDEEEY